MTLSYLVGQKKYPVNYPLRDIALYVVVALAMYFAMTKANALLPMWAALAANTAILGIFAAMIIRRDFLKLRGKN